MAAPIIHNRVERLTFEQTQKVLCFVLQQYFLTASCGKCSLSTICKSRGFNWSCAETLINEALKE